MCIRVENLQVLKVQWVPYRTYKVMDKNRTNKEFEIIYIGVEALAIPFVRMRSWLRRQIWKPPKTLNFKSPSCMHFGLHRVAHTDNPASDACHTIMCRDSEWTTLSTDKKRFLDVVTRQVFFDLFIQGKHNWDRKPSIAIDRQYKKR